MNDLDKLLQANLKAAADQRAAEQDEAIAAEKRLTEAFSNLVVDSCQFVGDLEAYFDRQEISFNTHGGGARLNSYDDHDRSAKSWHFWFWMRTELEGKFEHGFVVQIGRDGRCRISGLTLSPIISFPRPFELQPNGVDLGSYKDADIMEKLNGKFLAFVQAAIKDVAEFTVPNILRI
ncbi:hypothetical protein LGM43_26745 [Burkholderia seminalis]|uniref:hypothetical protein n=1 Tax=Burkholderia seminalis TaxID=488731 RepID=UPI001CF5A999|nr:hypothetical protein [Burkholderia seminalis]MCA7953872.1 hypothetical protein [Burkholderia seminalis]